uniref:Uncharacterized protein n=1 Tax=Anguilla anguilla TaxID=7936 RepID=A0A0E9RPA7_ANGAN
MALRGKMLGRQNSETGGMVRIKGAQCAESAEKGLEDGLSVYSSRQAFSESALTRANQHNKHIFIMNSP